GLAMLVFNQEIRFPTRLPFIQNKLGGALFYDAGNVFSRANRITFRSLPASPTDQNYLSHTVGIGFRYGTPIGPVRLDIGFLLNRGQFNVQCTTGSPGCLTGTTLSRLPRFQFSFNIGSIF
ncbi:MAG: BamA/TamA family outer membrane protein, partial [Acidobacteria bacterium]|nr:BamA/TamA family outer membrane protein [Acidobacteriota bacterium]